MTDTTQPVRVAIVGGGCAALSTAFELTRPELQGKYQVTVYQMGWRLGGKGASGRGKNGRIEEHGLHLWMGFYENAFRLMRGCYAERQTHHPECRFAEFSDAFKPAADVGIADRAGGDWEFWMARFPPGQGTPGDASTGDLFSVTAYLRQAIILVEELLRSAAAMEAGQCAAPAAEPPTTAAKTMDALTAALTALLRYGQLATATALIEAASILRQASESFFPQMLQSGAAFPLEIVDAIAVEARRQLHRQLETDRPARRVWIIIDLMLAVIRGSFRFGLALDPRGFDAINEYDSCEWMRLNGASELSLHSGFMRGLYDLAFAFEDGDVTRPRLAAGVALRGTMRMFFTYRGSLFWRMSAGMGDIVFAPLYQVLRDRGVQFKFFHRLRHVGLSPREEGEQPYVASLDFDVQARVKGGGEYQPLVDVHHVPSWPSRPDYSQLTGGAALEREGRAFEASWETRRAGVRTLHVQRDFDFVVLGLSVSALPQVAEELVERSAVWRDMLAHVKTVPTQAFQLWLRKDAAELGWRHPPANVSGYVEPFDTWADMTHLIPEENWTEPVKSIAYFCSVLPDVAKQSASSTRESHSQQRDLVRANAIRFLNQDVGGLWPKAQGKDGFVWNALAGAGDATGADAFDTQFWAANVNPTDRYVQALPGSIKYRISPLDMTFDNLTIAGDWTATGLDSGCIESAVMSGKLAAHALSGLPALQEIVGYDHP
ncbi:MAG: NAD(P)-binding protein [Candidatus Solibacter sp.]